MLSSVNLPGGQQRMKTYEDQLQMRSFFQEHDLISVSRLTLPVTIGVFGRAPGPTLRT